MRIKALTFILISAISELGAVTTLANVTVDLLQGYSGVMENGQNIRYYCGTLHYLLNVGDNDSVYIDFIILPVGGGGGVVEIIEKSGDVGLIATYKTDSPRTVLFRCKVLGDPAAQYTAIITADASKSAAGKLVESVISRLNDDEQYQLIIGADGKNFEGYPTDGYGTSDIAVTSADGTTRDTILGLRMCDSPHGVRWPLWIPDNIYANSSPYASSTLFPTEAATANSWNPELAEKIGAAIGREARAKSIYISLGPMINLVRHPAFGRSFETYGEDPVLCGTMAAAHHRGLWRRQCLKSR
jgi:hypothetical protein